MFSFDNCPWNNCQKVELDESNIGNYANNLIHRNAYTNLHMANFVSSYSGGIGTAVAVGTANYDGGTNNIKIELKATNMTGKNLAGEVSAIFDFNDGIKVHVAKNATTIVSMRMTDLTRGVVLSGEIDYELDDLDNYGNDKWEGVKPLTGSSFAGARSNPSATPPVHVPSDGVYYRQKGDYYTGFDANDSISNSVLLFKSSLANNGFTNLVEYYNKNDRDIEGRYFELAVDKIDFTNLGAYVKLCEQKVNINEFVKDCAHCEANGEKVSEMVRYRYELPGGAFQIGSWLLEPAVLPRFEGTASYKDNIFALGQTKYPFIWDSTEKRDCQNVDINLHVCAKCECNKKSSVIKCGDTIKKHERFVPQKNCYSKDEYDCCGQDISPKECWIDKELPKYDSHLCGIDFKCLADIDIDFRCCDPYATLDVVRYIEDHIDVAKIKNDLETVALDNYKACTGCGSKFTPPVERPCIKRVVRPAGMKSLPPTAQTTAEILAFLNTLPDKPYLQKDIDLTSLVLGKVGSNTPTETYELPTTFTGTTHPEVLAYVNALGHSYTDGNMDWSSLQLPQVGNVGTTIPAVKYVVPEATAHTHEAVLNAVNAVADPDLTDADIDWATLVYGATSIATPPTVPKGTVGEADSVIQSLDLTTTGTTIKTISSATSFMGAGFSTSSELRRGTGQDVVTIAPDKHSATVEIPHLVSLFKPIDRTMVSGTTLTAPTGWQLGRTVDAQGNYVYYVKRDVPATFIFHWTTQGEIQSLHKDDDFNYTASANTSVGWANFYSNVVSDGNSKTIIATESNNFDLIAETVSQPYGLPINIGDYKAVWVFQSPDIGLERDTIVERLTSQSISTSLGVVGTPVGYVPSDNDLALHGDGYVYSLAKSIPGTSSTPGSVSTLSVRTPDISGRVNTFELATYSGDCSKVDFTGKTYIEILNDLKAKIDNKVDKAEQWNALEQIGLNNIKKIFGVQP